MSPVRTHLDLRDPALYAVLGLAFLGILGGTLASPALPGVARAFAVSDARVGLVMTAFYAAATVAIPLSGTAADLYGRRPVILASLLVYGIGGAAIALADSLAAVLALRAVQGLAFPGTLPLSMALVGDIYEGRAATTVQGLRTSTNGVTGVLAPAVAGVAAGITWQAPFLLYALALPVFALCVAVLPEVTGDEGETTGTESVARETENPARPTDGTGEAGGTADDGRGASTDEDGQTSTDEDGQTSADEDESASDGGNGPTPADEDESASDGGNGPTPADEDGRTPVDGGRLVRARAGGRELLDAMTTEIRVLVVVTVALFLVRFALLTFVPLFLVGTVGTSEAVGGVAVSVLGLGRFVVAPMAGRIVDHAGRRWAVVGGLAVFAVGTGLLAVTGEAWLVLAFVAMLSAGEGVVNPVANDVVASETPAAVRARVVSALEVGKTGAVAVSPALFGAVLAATTYRTLFVVGAAVVAGAAVLAWLPSVGVSSRTA